MHQVRRERQLAQDRAEAAIALALEQGLPHQVAYGTIMRGWALAMQGQWEQGIAQIQQGLVAQHATGAEVARPSFLALLAEAQAAAGQAEVGLGVLAEALALVDHTGERHWEAEVYRLKGELLLLTAYGTIVRGWALAVQGQWETGIAQTRELLAPIYSWFTEGFDTPDLQEAKTLLEDLGT